MISLLQLHPLFALNILAAALAAATAAGAWRRHPTSGAGALCVLMAGVTLWCLASTAGLLRADLAWQLFWANATYLGVAFVPAAWLLFALQYTRRPGANDLRLPAALAVEPLLVLVLVWTNDAHLLFRSDVRLAESGGLLLLEATRGPAFWLHTAYAYALLTGGSALLLWHVVRTRGLYRLQAGTLLVAIAAPWAANVFFLSGRGPLPNFDLTPIGFAVSGVMLAWDLRRLKLLDILPVARDILIEQMGDGVVVLDDHSRVVDMNAAARRAFGAAAGPAIGRPAAELFAGWPQLVERYLARPDEVVEEVTLEGSGEPRVFDVRISPLHSRGLAGGKLIVWRDISARKRTEAALAEANRNLSALSEERARLLELAELSREAAEAGSRAKSRFLAAMSHELRTPLNAIMGYAQLLQREGVDPELMPDALRQIELSGEQLLVLITDLLDLAKIEAGTLALSEGPAQIVPLLADIAASARLLARRKGLEFQFRLEPSFQIPGTLCLDARRVRQVLHNLLGNAVKFTDAGEVALTASFAPPPAAGGRWNVRFQVDDTGVGIAEDDLARIVEPFQQASTPDKRADGAGLGLAVCVELLRLMGGELKVASAPGRGSSFWFTLALDETEAAEAEAAEAPGMPSLDGAGRKALIVDDDPVSRTLLATLLARSGFAVREAGNGQAGLAMARLERPAVVIVDALMPVLDGTGLVRALRHEQGLADAVIVTVSADAGATRRRASLEAGSDLFFAKPVPIATLFAALGRLLGAHAEPHEQAAPPVLPPVPLLHPSAEELAALHDLALVGDLRALRERLARLVAAQPELAPFADEARRSADGFQIDKLLALFEHALPAQGAREVDYGR